MRKGSSLFGSLLFVVVICTTTTAVGQDRRLVVVNPSEKELIKEANRLHVCPDRLKNIREALREAMEIAPEAVKQGQPSALGFALFRFESKQAEDLATGLFEKFLAQASRTSDSRELNMLRQSAFDLTMGLRRKNPDLAEKLESRWPPLPAAAGSPNAQDFSAQRDFYFKMERDPEQALLQLPAVEAGATNFGMRGNLLQRLLMEGKQDAAKQLLDETLALAPSADPRSSSNFGYFVNNALQAFPESRDRLLSSAAAWHASLSQAGGGEMDYPLPNGQKIRVSQADQQLLSLLSGIRQYPEFAEKLAALSPSLTAKMQEGGGLHSMLRWDSPMRSEMRRSLAQASDSEVESLVAQAPDLQSILSGVMQVCSENPEKAVRIFSALLKRIEAEPVPTKAAQDMMNAGQQCLFCLGEFPDDWYEAGKELVRELTEIEEKQPLPQPAEYRGAPPLRGHMPMFGRPTMSGQLEAFIMGKRARTDFSGVMGEIRAMTDKGRRFRILLRIIQDLSQG